MWVHCGAHCFLSLTLTCCTNCLLQWPTMFYEAQPFCVWGVLGWQTSTEYAPPLQQYVNMSIFSTDFQCFRIWPSKRWHSNAQISHIPRCEECTWCKEMSNIHGRLHWVVIQFNIILQHFIETFLTVNKSTTTNQCPRYASSQTF